MHTNIRNPALFLTLFLAFSVPLAAATPVADVRVLIDVSGSMKKNDPQTLRAEGLRLLIGLLPADARAGVWSFGRYVAVDTPVGAVDANWKAKAMAGAGRIHSRSQNTDIELALKRAVTGWQPSAESNRHVILLTDGMVDVGKTEADNQASRERIQRQTLPLLKQLGARVHTIALSQESDQALLQDLARKTDGWYEQIDSAEQLQRTFLRMFEKAAPRDTLPLVDNRFQVDTAIQELTLLVFRGARPAQLEQPDGRIYGRGQQPANVRWNQGDSYDLVTIDEPQPGGWRVIADQDPDNRVMVVTDLQLKTGALANNLAPEAHPVLSARLLQNDAAIVDPDFLKLVKVELEHELPGGQKIKRTLNRRAGVYESSVLETLDDGQHVFVWRADGGTFQRSVRQTSSVRVPVEISLIPLSSERGDHLFRVSARSDMIEPSTLAVTASIRDPSGRMIRLEIAPEDDTAWAGQFSGLTEGGTYNLFVTVNAVNLEGNAIELVMQPVEIDGTGTTAPVAEPAATANEDQESAIDWLKVGAWIAGFNLLIGGLGGLAYWLIRRRRPLSEVTLAEGV